MITFTLCLLALVAGYFIYGRFIEHVFGPDDRKTPAITKADGVDYIPLPTWKIFMIQFLNIAPRALAPPSPPRRTVNRGTAAHGRTASRCIPLPPSDSAVPFASDPDCSHMRCTISLSYKHPPVTMKAPVQEPVPAPGRAVSVLPVPE